MKNKEEFASNPQFNRASQGGIIYSSVRNMEPQTEICINERHSYPRRQASSCDYKNGRNLRLKQKLFKVLQGVDVYLDVIGGSHTAGSGIEKDEGGFKGYSIG